MPLFFPQVEATIFANLQNDRLYIPIYTIFILIWLPFPIPNSVFSQYFIFSTLFLLPYSLKSINKTLFRTIERNGWKMGKIFRITSRLTSAKRAECSMKQFHSLWWMIQWAKVREDSCQRRVSVFFRWENFPAKENVLGFL